MSRSDSPGRRLVLASNNAKKLKELQALLGATGVTLVAQRDLGIAEADEPHHTFVENALAKARHAAAASGLPAIADDSGLCVDALGGHPGVQSAHFAPIDRNPADDREAHRARQDAANNARLLADLAGADTRRARFVCALVAVRSADDPEPLIAFGRWDGEILAVQQGGGGFGYDPLMYIASQGCTAAEMATEVKNRLSHRARASAQMVALMREVWQLG
ncbi:RdgB/HAM1 family non-canonical purine NTP pyrophosphatase [Sphaerotilus microaerophilus]|uniref:dITP/XTP pyrophosphatase n=1 Tax=Sphaerotilus microaerophilus TaxID=2914710 RepID=A0ABN6PQR6_9BURK|nr:RdgB/HAM1 family non-canonical purine NTP pyrophosphatase [Sphaerotilus sp. FB-5]BDI07539.1 non-canonical purine NTP pyrophosphatase [Sphaerotilus sp. FB-5]